MTWKMLLNSWCITLERQQVLMSKSGPTGLLITQYSSRTLEWQDAEWEDGTERWPGYFEENAL